jgi:hypothetical protein
VRESLVLYREHSGALTNIPDSDRKAQASLPESVARQTRRVNMEMFLDFHHIACQKDTEGRIDLTKVLRSYHTEETKFFWMDMSLMQKLSAVISSAIEGNWHLSAWSLSRMLGIYHLIRNKQAVRS